MLAFDSSAAGQREIHVVSANGGEPQRVTNHPADDAEAVQLTREGGVSAYESPDGKSLYYTKERGRTSLWKIPVDGGEESLVLNGVYHVSFTGANAGMFFVLSDLRSIQELSYAIGETRVVAVAAELIQHPNLSPDGRWILYTQNEPGGNDLMLVENFRQHRDR